MNRRTSKLSVLVLVVFLIFSFSGTNAWASSLVSKSQVTKSTKSIENLLSIKAKFISSLDNLETKSIENLKLIYGSDLSKLTTDNDTLARSLNRELDFAGSSLEAKRVFIVIVDNIAICGSRHSDTCRTGDIVTMPLSVSEQLVPIAFLIKLGGIAPKDPQGYADALAIYQAKILALDGADSTFYSDKNTLANKLLSDQNDIYAAFNQIRLKAPLELQLLKDTLLAANRSTKSNSNFLQTFRTAFIFQFNAGQVYNLANTPISSLTSLLDIKNAKDALRWNDVATSISLSYSNSKALAFNKVWGNSFLTNANFQFQFKLAQKIFTKYLT